MEIGNLMTPPGAPPLQPGDLIDPKEAAAILCTTERTLANWRTLHKGPRFLKIGQRLVRYHRADLAEFVDGFAKLSNQAT